MGTSRTHEYVAGDIIAAKYRLQKVLGEGGMGSVWLARNVALDVDVALKLILRDIACDETAERLLQEARAAARLRHPSIVRIFDFGESELGDPFIVMEVLVGESLGDVLASKGRLPASGAVKTLLPVASALASAHAKGIVHRDLKPDNIVLVDDGSGGIVPKIVDFGIAKIVGQHEVAGRRLTRAGAVLGSVEYLSPEQARGREDIDQRADVWAFSVMLYEAVTGRLPFDGKNYNAILIAILEGTPAPLTDYGAGDEALWRIVSRGLAKEPAQRWQSIRTMGEALAAWAVERGATVDIAGTSLEAHWLSSVGPPAMSARHSIADRLSIPDVGGELAFSLLPPRPASAPPRASVGARDTLPALSTGAAVSVPQHPSRTGAPAAAAPAPRAAPRRFVVAAASLLALGIGLVWAGRPGVGAVGPQADFPSVPAATSSPEPPSDPGAQAGSSPAQAPPATTAGAVASPPPPNPATHAPAASAPVVAATAAASAAAAPRSISAPSRGSAPKRAAPSWQPYAPRPPRASPSRDVSAAGAKPPRPVAAGRR